MNTRKPLKVTGIILIFCILIFGFVMVFLQVFFAHHITYGNFMIYGTEEIDDHIYQILDSAGANLQASPFYYKALEQKIFFCNNPTVYTLFCYPARKTFGANWELWRKIFIASVDVEKNVAYRAMDHKTRSLVNLITHETTHTLIAHEIGAGKNSDLLTWKKEGYCDYVAKGGTLSFEEGVHDLCADRNLKSYFPYRLAVQYLIEERGISPIHVINDHSDYSEIRKTLKEKYCIQTSYGRDLDTDTYRPHSLLKYHTYTK